MSDDRFTPEQKAIDEAARERFRERMRKLREEMKREPRPTNILLDGEPVTPEEIDAWLEKYR